MEIEHKYIIEELPAGLNIVKSKSIKQGYISASPVIRIRQLGDEYFLTVKGKGLIAREEFEMPISPEEFQVLSKKVDGLVIHKTRHYIPYAKYTIELDIFHENYKGLMIAEVEFRSMDEANRFIPPQWFGKNVSKDSSYQNVNLSKGMKF